MKKTINKCTVCLIQQKVKFDNLFIFYITSELCDFGIKQTRSKYALKNKTKTVESWIKRNLNFLLHFKRDGTSRASDTGTLLFSRGVFVGFLRSRGHTVLCKIYSRVVKPLFANFMRTVNKKFELCCIPIMFI